MSIETQTHACACAAQSEETVADMKQMTACVCGWHEQESKI